MAGGKENFNRAIPAELAENPQYQKKSRRRRFPRARGRDVLGKIGKGLVYKPVRWLHEHSPKGEKYLNSRWKTLVDVIGLIPLAAIGIPTLALGVAYVSYKDKIWPWNAFYALPCVGKDGEEFGRLKIETMTKEAHNLPGFEVPMIIKSPDDPRVIHQSLRNSSIDELPQIINILKGDMSVVGVVGRPQSEIDYFQQVAGWDPALKGWIERFLELYPKARPGMTGIYQIMGRGDLNLADTARFEGWYLENASWVVDLTIMWGTLLAVPSRQGAY